MMLISDFWNGQETGKSTMDTYSMVETFGYSRGALPHVCFDRGVFFVTARLHDSVPESALEKMKCKLGLSNANDAQSKSPEELARWLTFWKQVQKYEDAGHGECWLSRPEIAQIVYDAFIFYDQKEYLLLAWTIMPNHFHLAIKLLEKCCRLDEYIYLLGKIMKGLKGFSSREANKRLGRTNQPFWQKEYHDRYIRSEKHLRSSVKYILNNPRKGKSSSLFTGTIFEDDFSEPVLGQNRNRYVK